MFAKKNLIILVLVLTVLSGFPASLSTAMAQDPFFSYTYDWWGEPVPSPHAYLPTKTLDGIMLDIGSFSNPRDIFVDHSNRLFIADTGNNRIVIVEHGTQIASIIDGFETQQGRETFNLPEGVFVTLEGHIYIADTENSRIVHLDQNQEFVRIIGAPAADIIPSDFVFNPSKLVVDTAGRLYVIARGVTQGIVEFDAQGIFRGFMGASRVTPSLTDIAWRAIATEAQRERMLLFIPTEYNSITIDNEGFLYVTTDTLTFWDIRAAVDGRMRDDRVAPVRKLNPTGFDVMRREGFFPPVGDVYFEYMEHSLLVDVDVYEHGIYSVLDARRGRIFTYDNDGNLLFVFGGAGSSRIGTFRNPVAIERIGRQILVLDATRATVTVFDLTEYGQMLKDAVILHRTGNYEESSELWAQVLKRNSNADLAYIGLGMSYMRQDQFGQAVDHFRLGTMRERFSRAFQLYRRQIIGDNFGLIVLTLISPVIITIIYKRLRRKSKKQEVAA